MIKGYMIYLYDNGWNINENFLFYSGAIRFGDCGLAVWYSDSLSTACRWHSRENNVLSGICDHERERSNDISCAMYAFFTKKYIYIKPAEIYRKLGKQYGNECLLHVQVYKWCHTFKNGRAIVEIVPHPIPPNLIPPP